MRQRRQLCERGPALHDENTNTAMFHSHTADTACNLCHSREAILLSDRDRHGGPLLSVMCKGCGLVRTDPMPDQETIDTFYREHYRHDYKGRWTPSRRHILRSGLVALDRLRRLPQFTSHTRRALDIGAGGGEFAYLLERARGFDVTGVEPNRGYAEHAARSLEIDVRNETLYTARIGIGEFDLVTVYHVLEHLRDPVASLSRIRSWLRPGGLMVVEVPDIEATCQSPGHLFHFAHLYNFNAATLEHAGRRAGLVPVGCWHSPDGGNVSVTFRTPQAPMPAFLPDGDGCGMPSNAWRVEAIRSSHTTARHYASWRPWSRTARRLTGRLVETLALWRLPRDPRAVLDALWGDARRSGSLGIRTTPVY